MPWIAGDPTTDPTGGTTLVETPSFTHARPIRVRVLVWTEQGFDALFELRNAGDTAAVKSQFVPGQLVRPLDMGVFNVGIGERLRLSTREGADVTGDVQASIFYDP